MIGAGKYTIIGAKFPKSVTNDFLQAKNLDQIGPATFVEMEQLGKYLLGVGIVK